MDATAFRDEKMILLDLISRVCLYLSIFGKGYENLEDAVEDGMNLLAQYIGKSIKFTTQGWEIKYVKK